MVTMTRGSAWPIMPFHKKGAKDEERSRPMAPSTAVRAPAMRPRKRKASASSASLLLGASAVRKIAAGVAQSVTAISPIVREKGVSQREPRFVSIGVPLTRILPLATAAAERPRKKGVITLEKLKMRLHILNQGFSDLSPCVRKTKAAPRRTTPINARVSGIKRTTTITAKGEGNAENRPTTRKTSHT